MHPKHKSLMFGLCLTSLAIFSGGCADSECNIDANTYPSNDLNSGDWVDGLYQFNPECPRGKECLPPSDPVKAWIEGQPGSCEGRTQKWYNRYNRYPNQSHSVSRAVHGPKPGLQSCHHQAGSGCPIVCGDLRGFW